MSDLERFGYKQELKRAMSGYSSFALSFSVISILTGGITLFSHGLAYGGPFAMTVGWPIVSAGTLLVAVAMAELASAFPTAGALYHWAHLLGGKGIGWLTAWLNLIGQVSVTAGVDYGCAKFLAVLVGSQRVLPIYAAILLSHALINHAGVRLVGWLNDLSASVHMLGVAALVCALVCFAPHVPARELLSRTHLHDGSGAWLFFVALLQPLWTFTGFDASAHVAEETRDAARRAPVAIISAVAVSAVFGYVLVVALLWAAPPGAWTALAGDDTAPLTIVTNALGAHAGQLVMALVIAAMWFCGLASLTANSRMIFAFARDGGLPAACRTISSRWRTPVVAIWVSASCALLLVAASLAVSDAAYMAVTSLSTTALYLSYALPMGCGLWARTRWQRRGPFALGRASVPIALAACVWLGAAAVLCMLPPNGVVGITMISILLALAAGYWMRARTAFAGPQVSLAALEDGPR